MVAVKMVDLSRGCLCYSRRMYVCCDNFLLPRIPDDYEYAKLTMGIKIARTQQQYLRVRGF